MSDKSPVWPGPRLMIPIPTDVLLVGNLDKSAAMTWAELKNDYYGQWQLGATAQPAPFGPGTCPDVGAHLMWTLPNSFRRGSQQQVDGAPVDFPNAPNRWVVTRFGYGADGVAPTHHSVVIQSDLLTNAGAGIRTANQFPQYDLSPAVQGIGKAWPLIDWSGEQSVNPNLLKAIGPGDITWAVTYDNIKNVFSLHDDTLPDNAGVYTYSIIGWYSDPSEDPTYNLPTTDGTDAQSKANNWKSALEGQFQLTSEDVEQAVADWLTWQQNHGLEGPWDPDSLHLPPQAKAAIVEWHKWQQTNGETAEQANLPIQSLSHSMIATVQWKGTDHAYGQGIPLGGGGKPKLPEIVIGESPEEVISTYMATKASETPGSGITPADVPNLSKVLEAFQKDLLFDLQSNTAFAESMLHESYFNKKYAGQEWIVVLNDDIQMDETGTQNRQGQQSIPLDKADTDTLIQLNKGQASNDKLLHIIDTQRKELYALSMKLEELTLNRGYPAELRTKTEQSIKAISAALKSNIKDHDSQASAIKLDAEQFQHDLGQEYLVKAVDLPPIAAPADPVVLFSGGDLDTKLLPTDIDGVSQKLRIRFTGQTINAIDVMLTEVQAAPVTIDATDMLDKVALPAWNAIPKEVLDLWVETLFLDTSNAELIAKIYFTKTNHNPVGTQLSDLTTKITTQQTALWNKFEDQPPTAALTHACGFGGLMCAHVGVAYRPDKQPWTPIYMDWKIKWYPVPNSSTDALKNWEFGPLDYSWTGSSIDAPSPEVFYEGRAVLNIKTTRNIQQKFTTFVNDPNYEHLPENTIQNLEWVSKNVQYLDLVTQSMSGVTEQMATLNAVMKNEPTDAKTKDLLAGSTYFDPVSGSEKDEDSEPFYPIRSGHFQVIDLWLVDSFGQVLKGKSNLLQPSAPINNIIWTSNTLTSSPNYTGETKTFGQLPPRFAQDAKFTPRFLQSDNDDIISNSADRTSPICGWVMANHLDNSLMVFNAAGQNLGAVIKVQRETTGTKQVYTIRWDAVPGSNTALGASPQLDNDHLQNFINNLLETGTAGSQAYDDLMSSIDSTLWSSNKMQQNGNLAILLGRPIAVVRGEVELNLAGMPEYNQSWFQTGEYYNDNGTYNPIDPPFVSIDFNVRVGDSLREDNGVLGYFEADNYNTFHSVYGINGQTDLARQMLAKEGTQVGMDDLSKAIKEGTSSASGYVTTNHLVKLAANQYPVKLTLLIDPSGGMPIVPGSLPGSTITLNNGPVHSALTNLKATFRTGPLLLDPDQIQMPTPSEVQGNWSWLARKDVTTWGDDTSLMEQTSSNSFDPTPRNLIEGWLVLSNSQTDEQ